jgi:hypothetical protein
MATNFVKFQRGSQAAYDLLVKNGRIDDNTLYFIYPASGDTGSVGKLYLGSRLISGGDVVLTSASLSDLADVIVNETKANSFLVQNAEGKWDNMALADVVTLIKNNLGEIAAPANVFQVDLLESDADDIAAISRVVAASNKTLAAGDIAVVKAAIVANKYSRTGYVYNGAEWVAMDGNYNAENVYFADNLTVTSPIGTITQEMIDNGNGAATLTASGKNVKEVFAALLAEAKDPSVTQPTASMSVSGGSGEVGTSYTVPTATLTVTDGAYTYGSKAGSTAYDAENTGVTYAVGAVKITESTSGVTNNSASNTAVLSGDSNSITLKASGTTALYADTSKKYTFTGEATYTSSDRVPINNLGDLVPTKQIGYNATSGLVDATKALSVTGTTEATFSGWRKMFMGTVDEYNEETGTKTPITITSDVIRKLNLISKQVSTSAQTFTVPVGATKIIVACPEEYSISKCEYFTMSWETIANFPAVADVEVADARGGSNGLKNYNVYVFEHASPSGFEAATQYRVTLKKG